MATPQFVIEGDELNVIGKVLNYGTDTAKLNRTFKLNGAVLKQSKLEVTNSVIDTFKVNITPGDSLVFEYNIQRESGYFDGEQRKIPVIKRGVTETKGFFEALDKDTTITMNFDPKMGPVTFRAEASVLPTLAEETRRLRDYVYQCNEQLASKLKGLLAEKRIATYLGTPFKWDRNINEVIKTLESNKRGQGLWGWWKDADEEVWISLHAIEALTEAKKAGYSVRIDQNKLTDYLVYQMNTYKGVDKILSLQLLNTLNAKVNYEQYITAIDKELTDQKKPSLYDQYRLMLLKQQVGLTVNTSNLQNTVKRTLFGNIYWGENNTQFFDNSIQLSILGYKILKAEGKRANLLAKIRGYFLEQHHDGEWRNTYETALILETILPDVLLPGQQSAAPSLILSGAKNTTITNFPHSETFDGERLIVKKNGSLPVYITGYQQYFNNDPQKVNKDFAVSTWFEKNGNKLTTLKGGQSAILKAEVDVKGDAEYIMINIPIPAGCSYDNKSQSWLNNEVHREYFKERVSIFCRKLKQGKYEFSIDLMPRYSGKYNLNPAKAEMMYFPIFYGREAIKQVTIGN
ncbi:alpha-2-macroglobulin family protein [Mucilaginibacter auburnensis]|uniref:alpha-2-macroglobulin family protein n=1 Tax=Mucilaginibacter auburnensis TaxID=1457233 RepID=UPI003743E5C4